MFAIVVNEKGGEQKRLEFDKPEVTIGRVQGNDIILPKGNVSKRHSRIVLKDGKFIIVDLKSTNGTYVNGRKITSPLVVKGSDKIYIGDFILSIEELQAGAGDSDVPPSPPRAKQPTIPPPPPRRAPTGSFATDSAEDSDGGNDEPREETPPPPEPMRSARPTSPPNPSNPSMPAMSATSPPMAAPRPAPVLAAPIPARQQSPSRVDLPVQARAVPAAPAPVSRAPSSPSPIAAARPAPAARVQPATQKRAPVVAVDDSKRGKLTNVMRELATRLSATLGVDSGNVDTTQEEDLWTRAESAASDLLEQLGADGAVPPGTDTSALLKDVVAETVGSGPLDELLSDESVREVSIPRYDRVFVDRGEGVQLHGKWFSSPDALTRVVERMMSRAGRQMELHAARGAGGGLVEARIEGGVLLAAALPPLAARGPALTLRRPRKGTAKLTDLTGDGVLSQGMADFLELALKQRRNIVVSGPAGSGRSTLLGALGRLAAEWGERIATVEEAEELDLGDGAHVALVGRGAHARLAMQAAMRMRPDRVIVGDVRGAEALDLSAVMTSGADGAMCAVQAGSARDALQRLAQLARMAPEAPGADTLREELSRGVQVIVQMTRSADGDPRVAEICEVDGDRVQAVFTYKPDAAGGRFAPTGHVPAWADGAPPSTFRA